MSYKLGSGAKRRQLLCFARLLDGDSSLRSLGQQFRQVLLVREAGRLLPFALHVIHIQQRRELLARQERGEADHRLNLVPPNEAPIDLLLSVSGDQGGAAHDQPDVGPVLSRLEILGHFPLFGINAIAAILIGHIRK